MANASKIIANTAAGISTCAKLLREGELVAVPTETV
jgi:tRNA A37 threonylcarbamoyladenosine synthetase subunit TsaC/SUA5/YrdC